MASISLYAAAGLGGILLLGATGAALVRRRAGGSGAGKAARPNDPTGVFDAFGPDSYAAEDFRGYEAFNDGGGGGGGDGDGGSEGGFGLRTIFSPFVRCMEPSVGGRGFKGEVKADVGAWLESDPTAGFGSSDNPLRLERTFSDF